VKGPSRPKLIVHIVRVIVQKGDPHSKECYVVVSVSKKTNISYHKYTTKI
jgi:hypothetical protein